MVPGNTWGHGMSGMPLPRAAELKRTAEWPTLVLLALTYGTWVAATIWVSQFSVGLAIALCAWAAAQHSSLTHEALHGHPTLNPVINAALVLPALSLVVPYLRFRDMHLAHHQDESLTDPYDDPETNYLDPAVWDRLPRWRRALCRINNTLAGRLVLGPLLGQIGFMATDWRLIRSGDQRVLAGWLLHIPAVACILWWMTAVATLPIWAWLISVYLSLSLLKLRTFLEHRAHDCATARTAIVEDSGFFGMLFLNNNLHVVHHLHPGVPWYALPTLYRAGAQHYLNVNQGYRYDSYLDVAHKYLFRTKDPVPHPIYRDGQDR